MSKLPGKKREPTNAAMAGAGLLLVFLSLGCGGATTLEPGAPAGTGIAGGAGAGAGGDTAGAGAGGASTGGTSTGGCSTDPNDSDVDGDGYPRGEDCDDTRKAVNPGAFDIPGNGMDDDCDGGIDNGAGMACDDANDIIPMDTNDPMAMARAMGICGKDPGRTPVPSWGVWGVDLWGLYEPWSTKRYDLQHGVHTELGPTFLPKQGRSMLMLATGIARTQAQPGGTISYPSFYPWGSPTGELLPNDFPEKDPICKAKYKDTTAWDPIALHISLRVPTNAVKLRWSARAVIPEYVYDTVCAGQNHFFGAFEGKYAGSSGAVNLALLPDGSPFSVDHLPFVFCKPAAFEEQGRPYDFPCPKGSPDAGSRPWAGSATDWIDLETNVVPGHDFELTLITWSHGDIGGRAFGVLLDDFQWIASPASSPACSP